MKLGASLAALAALQLGASVVLQVVVLAVIGPGTETDSWVAAQTVPLVVYAVFVVAFQGAWQSHMAVVATDTEVWVDAQRAAQGQLLLAFGIVAAVLAATASWWVDWMFHGFSSGQARDTVRMTRLLMLGALL